MTEFQALPHAQADAQKRDLWRRSPAWRKLNVAAVALTVAAIAASAPLFIAPTPEATPVTAPHQTMPPPTPAALPSTAPARPLEHSPQAEVAPPLHIAKTEEVTAAPAVLPPPLAAPATQPAVAPQPSVCLLSLPTLPVSEGTGVALTLEDHATSLARIRRNQVSFGGDIDPAYVINQRVYVHMDGGGLLVLLAPEGMVIHPGDRVSAQTTFRNPNLPCAYIPNLITADLGPAPSTVQSSQASPPAKTGAAGSPTTP